MTTIYDVLRRPLVTEKTNYQSNRLHQYVFEVAPNATRTEVKDAVELICLLYTSDAADDLLCVDLGGRRIIKKKITFLRR